MLEIILMAQMLKNTLIAGLAAGGGAFASVSFAKAVNPAVRLPDPAFAGAVAGLAGLLPGLLARNPTQQEVMEAAATVLFGGAAFAALYEWNPRTPFQAFARDVLLSIAIGYGARAALGLAVIPQFAAAQLGPVAARP